MSLTILLEKLKSNSMFLEIQHGQLKLKSKDKIPADILSEVRANKEALMELLQEGTQRSEIVNNEEATGLIPVTSAQSRMCLMDSFGENQNLYNLGSVYKLHGKIEPQILKQAFELLVNRHEAFRTNFVEKDNEFYQKIHNQVKVNFEIVYKENMQEVNQYLLKSYKATFDIFQDSLLRIRLVKHTDTISFLLISLHHIIFDGWSENILMKELIEAYNGLKKNHDFTFLSPATQYSKYAKIEYESIHRGEFDKYKNYWINKLGGIPFYHNLPENNCRKSIPTYKGGVVESEIEGRLLKNFETFCRNRGATLLQGVYSAFSALLIRYSGEEDVVIGVPVMNRDDAEFLNCIGLFVNTLVLRTKVDEQTTFEDLFYQCRQNFIEAIEHQAYPFEKLVEALNPPRDSSRNPIFQVMLSVQNETDFEHGFENVSIERYSLEHNTSKFDLTLNCYISKSGIKLYWEYSEDIFSKEFIERMATAFQTILWNLVELPQANVLSFSFPLKTTNLVTDSIVPIDFLSRFRDKIRNNPEQPALEMDGLRITYAELDLKSEQYVIALKEIGAGKGSVIALLLNKGPNLFSLLIAIMKIEACFVTLDPNYPENRLGHMIEDSGASVLIMDSENFLLEKSKKLIQLRIFSDGQLRLVNKGSYLAEKLAGVSYIMYTSGSTGNPKGVKITKEALSSYASEIEVAYKLDKPARILSFSNISFDIFIEELISWLITGSTMVIMPEHLKADPDRFINFLNEQKISFVTLPTAFWHFIVTEASINLLETLNFLEMIVIGGEDYRLDILNKWQTNTREGIRLLNTYGPTENCPVSTYKDISHVKVQSNIGKPLVNIDIEIVNNYGGQVPAGAIGELVLKGPQLFSGYRGASVELSKYRTGDLVRETVEGDLQYIGRKDSQVKISGFRVEPKEYENILRKISGIENYCLLSKKDFSNSIEELHCSAYDFFIFIVPETEEEIDLINDEIKRLFLSELPPFMRRVAVKYIHKIPMNNNGKIDKNNLFNYEINRSKNEKSMTSNPVANAVYTVWEEILGHSNFDNDTNFFDAGGSSLAVLSLSKKIELQFGKKLTVIDLYRFTTVNEIVSFLQNNTSNDKKSDDHKKRVRKNIMRDIKSKKISEIH
ncbi:non-ribosomal peptide synthetase [Bacillus ndiopicus]|uniref:non-ribosomal peptide synthetase n=1 Tax=Bacillus ndiopicus TaxID=1347368 RepID=UPI0005A7A1BF|nr:condensation domain-containing protein [Bacillus ndiopicus]